MDEQQRPKVRPEDRPLTIENIAGMVADPDLTNVQLGALIRFQYIESATIDSLLIPNANRHIHEFTSLGWMRIKSTYRIRQVHGGMAWIYDEVITLRERKDDLGLWLVTYQQKTKQKKHSVIVSGINAEDAMANWQHAWPRHQLVDIRSITNKDHGEFEAWAEKWSFPQGLVAAQMKFREVNDASRIVRHFKTSNDPEAFNYLIDMEDEQDEREATQDNR